MTQQHHSQQSAARAAIIPAGYFGNFGNTKRPTGNAPLLQWFNALPAGRSNAIGWHIQASRCNEALTQALKDFGYERLTVHHRMTGEMVEYWSLETASLFILCNGFTDAWQMRQSSEREGLAYGWIDAKGASKLKVRVISAELANVGYIEPFTVSLEGMITDVFLEALQQQFRVLDTFEQLTGEVAPFYGFALELGPAERPRMVGNNGKQSPIIPIVANVPSMVGEQYLTAHIAPPALLQRITEQDMIRKAIAWSIDTSARINRGDDKESWETAEYDEALHHERTPEHQRAQPAEPAQQPAEQPDNSNANAPVSQQQRASIGKLCQHLGRIEPDFEEMSFIAAKRMIAALAEEYNHARKARAQ